MKKIFTYLIAVAALLVVSSNAKAQGGLAPFVGSTHEYTVSAEDATNNTLEWTVSGGALNTDYTISGEDTEQVEITWLTAGDYTVVFTETTPAPASCSTIKEKDVTVGTNDFDVNIGTLTDACNNNSGTVSPADSATSIITIPFDMETGGATWSPNWQVTFDLSVTSSNARFLSVALASEASGTLTNLGSGSYSITGISSASGIGSTGIEVTVKGYSFADVTVDVEITAAKEAQYNTPAASTGSWAAVTNTIYEIPNTSDINTD